MANVKDIDLRDAATTNNVTGLPGVLEFLHDSIVRGDYQPGVRLPSERALAQEFRIDRYSIRTVLSQLEQMGLIVRRPGCRPFVRHTGGFPIKAGTQPKDCAFAAVFPDHEINPATRACMRGVNGALRATEKPFRLQFFDTIAEGYTTDALETEACETIRRDGIAGAIVFPRTDDTDLTRWTDIRDAGHSIVFLDHYNEDIPCDFVGVDNFQASKEAVEYLIGLGHRRIGYFTERMQISTARDRLSGYRAALDGAGIEVESDLIFERYPPADVDDYVRRCLDAPEPPTAFAALNDILAYRLIACLEAHGKSVPGDFSVVGFDDIDRYSARPPFLTTMQQPFDRMGRRAAELLLIRVNDTRGPHRPYQHVIYQTRLIERNSCRPVS